MGRFTSWLLGLPANTDPFSTIAPKAPARVRVWAERAMEGGTVQQIDLGAYPTEQITFTLRGKVHPRTWVDSAGYLTFLRIKVESDDGTYGWPVTNHRGGEDFTIGLDDVITIDVPLTVRYS